MVKLVICVMYSDRKLFEETKRILEEKFGGIEDSVSYDFNHTTYYEDEMGKNLKKDILVFKQLIKEEQLPEIKGYTNSLEDKYRVEGKRRINLDPGYLTEKELILASNKKSPYKKEIGKGIYAHLTLKFEDGRCVTTHRTYPDFKKEEVQKLLLKTIKSVASENILR